MAAEPIDARRFEGPRHRLIEKIRDAGIDDLEILRVFDLVPRHLFLPEAVWPRSYEDSPLPIGFGQTASQPSLQALYLKLLRLGPRDRVLEIGTGSGFLTALLAHFAGNVYSVERIGELSRRARRVLDDLGIKNVALHVGDGSVGWAKYAPYDAILVSAASPGLPTSLVQQLAPAGKLLIPIGSRQEQKLMLLRRTEQGFETDEVTGCVFVPLIGRHGWSE